MIGRSDGFTTIEMVLVVVVMGIMATIGFPRIRDAIQKQSVRSARVAGTAMVVKARAAAVQRGCRATLHLNNDGRIWVTACPTVGTGLDTVGTVDNFSDRFGVTMTATGNAVQYDPRGLAINQATTVWFRRGAGDMQRSDSVMINAVGKVVR